MTQTLLSQLPQPLAYAETLLGWIRRLGLEDDDTCLPNLCVAAAAQLSQCELSHLYWRDETSGRLALIAQHASDAQPLGDRDFQHE